MVCERSQNVQHVCTTYQYILKSLSFRRRGLWGDRSQNVSMVCESGLRTYMYDIPIILKALSTRRRNLRWSLSVSACESSRASLLLVVQRAVFLLNSNCSVRGVLLASYIRFSSSSSSSSSSSRSSTSTSSSSSSSSSISILKAQLSMLKETNRMDKLTYYCYDATSIYYLVYYITHTDTEVYWLLPLLGHARSVVCLNLLKLKVVPLVCR